MVSTRTVREGPWLAVALAGTAIGDPAASRSNFARSVYAHAGG